MHTKAMSIWHFYKYISMIINPRKEKISIVMDSSQESESDFTTIF